MNIHVQVGGLTTGSAVKIATIKCLSCGLIKFLRGDGSSVDKICSNCLTHYPVETLKDRYNYLYDGKGEKYLKEIKEVNYE